MSDTFDCMVLGAGAVGVSTAIHLQRTGARTVLVDRQPAGEGTSFGNAGIIQAEGIMPYLLPRDLRRVFNMALNRRPEAHVHYRAVAALAPWLLRFWWNSSEAGMARGAAAHLPLVQRCVTEHEALMEAAGSLGMARRTGFLRIYRDTADLERDEAEHQGLADKYGVAFETLNPDKLQEHEPHLSHDLVGGIWLKDPVSVGDPSALVKSYADLFRREGGRFITADGSTLSRGDTGWQVKTVDGPVTAKNAVVALGPWSREVLLAQGVEIPLAVKRGYHMHYRPRGNAVLNRPVFDVDNGYVIAPMRAGIRLTTGAEFAFRDAPATPKQLAKVRDAAFELFPLAVEADPQPWMGARPCLPDMVPMIGPVPGRSGLWANFGHHHLGLTLGPVSGRLLAEMVSGKEPFCDPAPYRVGRFG